MNKGVRTLPPLGCGGTGRTPFLLSAFFVFLLTDLVFNFPGVFE